MRRWTACPDCGRAVFFEHDELYHCQKVQHEKPRCSAFKKIDSLTSLLEWMLRGQAATEAEL